MNHPQNQSCHENRSRRPGPFKFATLLLGCEFLLNVAVPSIRAQCPAIELTAGLKRPLSIVQSSLGNLLVSETTSRDPNSGRISIVALDGNRRTLLAGLPSGISDVGDPLGPSGLYLRGRTLYLLLSVGDVAIGGPFPGTSLVNPNPPSSPLFSSVLALHFSANVEKSTEGFQLPLEDHPALAAGRKLTLFDSANGQLTIERVADFPNYISLPLPTVPDNVQLSNPFALVGVDDQLFVTDGGRNLVWQVDIPTGAISPLATFPNIPNPLFPAVGGPTSQAVPTGIRYVNGRLLVALFRGVPFAPGTSVIEEVNPLTGVHAPLITGLKTAIDVLPIPADEPAEYLVLQNASVGPFFNGPGLLLRFTAPGGAPSVAANCLDRPTSMTFDERTSTVFAAELNTGRIVAIPLAP